MSLGHASLGRDQIIESVLVVGLADPGRAVADADIRRGVYVVSADVRPSPAALVAAADRGIALHVAPTEDELLSLIGAVDIVVPSPGVPRHHAVYRISDELAVPIVSELDLAARWDDRPQIAITGTNGKTTVTTLVTSMLKRDGRPAVAAGNVDVPLVEAIDRTDEPRPEWFVVEASSFRLERVTEFSPHVGAWLNLAPDHLDWHDDLGEYAAAKARIWRNHRDGDVKVVPFGDRTIGDFAALAGGRTTTFGLDDGDVFVAGGRLVTRLGADAGRGDAAATRSVVEVSSLPRRLPHDLLNACAAAACALSVGVSLDAVRSELMAFEGLAHRMARIGVIAGVPYFNDSKATTPEATVAAVQGFERAVLIAGGRNKGLDLSSLGSVSNRLSAVIAIGEAADDIERAFAGSVPVRRAASMEEAVRAASDLAGSADADAVVLSPACASYDWYLNYAERGDDFARIVDRSASEDTL